MVISEIYVHYMLHDHLLWAKGKKIINRKRTSFLFVSDIFCIVYFCKINQFGESKYLPKNSANMQHFLTDNHAHTLATFETASTLLPTLLLFDIKLGDIPAYGILAQIVISSVII